MTLHVAVDFGTSSTCVAVSVDGREPQVVMVDGGSPVMPSAVYAAVDGTVFVGQEAERQAAIDPSRYEPHPKRRIDEGQLLLGNTVVDVLDVVRAVLARAVGEARRFAGNAPADLLVLTHPADWGALRTRTLRQAASGLAQAVALVPEPVAAAVFHASGRALADRAALAVLDLGGGTVDVSVVRRDPTAQPAGFQVLASHGDPNFGGADIDQLLLEHVGRQIPVDEQPTWRALMEGREMADRRRRRVLRQDVRGAKETLSRHAYTDVPLPPPFADAHVTRDDLERLVTEPLRRAATLTMDAVTEAGLRPNQLAGLFLVGGASRIPLVARLLTERTGIIPTTLDQPETVVARGALRAVGSGVRGPADTSAGRPADAAGLPGAARVPPSGALTQAATAGRSPGVRPGLAGPLPERPPGYPNGATAPSVAPGTQIRPALGTALPGGQPAAPRSAPGGLNGNGSPFPPTGGPNEATQRIPVQPVGQAGGGGPAGPNSVAGAGRRPTPRRRRTSVWLVVGGVLVVVAAVIGFVAIDQPGQSAARGAAGSTPTAAATSAPVYLAQYDYRFPLPVGWSQTASDPNNLGTGITPQNAPSSFDEIYVEEFRLDNDATAAPSVTITDLRKKVQGAGGRGFNASARYAGRSVVYYQLPGNGFVVDWYVMFQGKIQVSVGCQYPSGTRSNIDSACQQVVSGATIRGSG
jgi:type VII secretion-associated protein (TIGR03931 family)